MFLDINNRVWALSGPRGKRFSGLWVLLGGDGKCTINYNRDISGESKHKFEFKTLTLFKSITRYKIYNSVNNLIALWPKRRSIMGAKNTKMGGRITPIKVDSN